MDREGFLCNGVRNHQDREINYQDKGEEPIRIERKPSGYRRGDHQDREETIRIEKRKPSG